jgi:type I restriction enzyme M protein
VNKANVQNRLKEIKGDADAKEEIKVLKTYLDLLEQRAETNKKIKEAGAELDKKLYAKYPTLTEDEIQTLVVDDKWI